jgi:hypothetical protein
VLHTLISVFRREVAAYVATVSYEIEVVGDDNRHLADASALIAQSKQITWRARFGPETVLEFEN